MKTTKYLERLIIAVIVLAVVHTFFIDYAVFRNYSADDIKKLVLAGLIFDFIFTIEFSVRSVSALKNGRFMRYFLHERGWIDFLSSIPLLFMNSIPSVLLLYFNESSGFAGSAVQAINTLKIVKAVRITRILRLVRVIKILGKIHNADSKMAQHHASYISAMSVFTVIIVFLLFSVFTHDASAKTSQREQQYSSVIHAALKTNMKEADRISLINGIFSSDPYLISAEFAAFRVINVGDERLRSEYLVTDYLIYKEDGITIKYSIRDINSEHALISLLAFFIILSITAAVSVIYARHFAMKVSDILHIIHRGMTDRTYNLEVKPDVNCADHEIFGFARYYNEKFLPAKFRRYSAMNAKSLNINDIMNFNKEDNK